jgi:chromosome segregation ATPase
VNENSNGPTNAEPVTHVNGAPATGEQGRLQDIELELNAIKALNRDKEAVVQKLEEENQQLRNSNQELQMQLTNPTDDQFQKTAFYLSLRQQVQSCEQTIANHTHTIDSLKQEQQANSEQLKQLREVQLSQRDKKMEDKLNQLLLGQLTEFKQLVQERNQLKMKLAAMALELHRGNVIDVELIESILAKKGNFGELFEQHVPTTLKTIKEIITNLKISELMTTLSALRVENQQIKSDLDNVNGEMERYRADPEKNCPGCKDLTNLVKKLQHTIFEHERKEKKYQEREMTLKDALSAKMISPEDRQLFLQRIDEQINARDQARNVSSEINQLKTEKSDLQIKLSKAEKGKEELTKRLSGLKDESTTLIGEIEAIAKTFEDVEQSNKALSTLLAEKEDTNLQLLHDRIKFQQQIAALTREKEVLLDKLHENGAFVTQSKQVLEQHDKSTASLNELLNKYQEETRSLEKMLELQKNATTELTLGCNDLKNRLKKMEENFVETSEKAKVHSEAHSRESRRSETLQRELEGVRRRLERYASGKTSNAEDQIFEYYQRLVRCSICNEREKSVVIARPACFHAFCEHCIGERVKVRNRKCPRCAKQFGADDVQKLYL